MTNKVQKLISEIESLAAERGLHLHRYQTNLGSYRVRITYALHDTPEKPALSASCSVPSVVLNNREGTTERCEAYRELSELMEQIG